jgi:hypothetical protein
VDEINLAQIGNKLKEHVRMVTKFLILRNVESFLTG